MNNLAKARMMAEMKQEAPVQAHIGTYLNWLRAENAAGADSLEADIVETFTTETGLRVLKLMEKSVLYAGVPNGAPESALREVNAVRNFVLEIRRLVSNG